MASLKIEGIVNWRVLNYSDQCTSNGVGPYKWRKKCGVKSKKRWQLRKLTVTMVTVQLHTSTFYIQYYSEENNPIYVPFLSAFGFTMVMSRTFCGSINRVFPRSFQTHGSDVALFLTYPYCQQKSTLKSRAPTWLQIWPNLTAKRHNKHIYCLWFNRFALIILMSHNVRQASSVLDRCRNTFHDKTKQKVHVFIFQRLSTSLMNKI